MNRHLRNLTIAGLIAVCSTATSTSSRAQNSSLLHAPERRTQSPGQRSITQPQSPPVQGVTSGQGVTAQGFAARDFGNPSAPMSGSSLVNRSLPGRIGGPTPSFPGQLTQMRSPTELGTPQSQMGQGQLAGRGQMASQGPIYGSDPEQRPRVTISEASWTYQPPPPMRVFRKNDLVTIRVDEITRVMAEGASESRKRTLYEAILTDWIRLAGLKLRPDPQLEGDPTVGAESNSNFRAESTVESRESLTFNIAATVVDIRPNGMLVLEGTKAIRVNDNLWETAISGLCRAQDVGPDNIVLSKDLIGLEIKKLDRGHLRDGYKRGWLQRTVDRIQPF